MLLLRIPFLTPERKRFRCYDVEIEIEESEMSKIKVIKLRTPAIELWKPLVLHETRCRKEKTTQDGFSPDGENFLTNSCCQVCTNEYDLRLIPFV